MPTPRDYTVHMIGHGHIDPTWLWRWTEGYEEVRATFRSALDRMKETPGFIFTASSACFYAWVKECDPEMFEEIRARIREGRWDIAGGMWIEPDCNIPGGEAFVRQGLYAQRFFEHEFGTRAKVGFNPDSFGHAGTLPQILKKLGMNYYVYQRPEPVREMQYPGGTTFWWQANDGSRVLTCTLLFSYNADDETAERIKQLAASPHLNDGQRDVLGFFGVGNHGGGPTKSSIAQVLKTRTDKNSPLADFSTLLDYFSNFTKSMKAEAVPTISTDLQHHAQGCYTTHSEIKRLNRRAEHALMAAERFATAAWLQLGHTYPAATLEKAWKDVLYNQFHDILAGTSLESSYEDARDQIGGAKHAARVVLNESVQVIARSINTSAEGNTLMVVNPLPWPVTQVVTAPPITARTLTDPLHVADDAGKIVNVQSVRDERIGSTAYVFVAEIPALGYRCYNARSGERKAKVSPTLTATRHSLENAWWRLEVDPYSGQICRLYDKKARIEVLTKGNVLAAIVDASDTWGHDTPEYRNEAGRFADAQIDLIESGPVRATLRVQSRYAQSRADQFIHLYAGTNAIDCVFRINWQDRYTVLKLAYETAITKGTATYDTAYGSQIRNIDGFEEPGQKWFDLTGTINGKPYGLAVLNDCKYGFDVKRGTMRVTMLRSPAYAHHDPARFDASRPFAIMDQAWHTVRIRLLPHAGPWQDAGVARASWELNEPSFVHHESAHKGTLPVCESHLNCDAPNVLLSVLKKSEDGDDLVIRGYETCGRAVKAVIKGTALKKPVRTTFAPHEIKTLRVDPRTGAAVEANLLEEATNE